jgi:hypothetical protein
MAKKKKKAHTVTFQVFPIVEIAQAGECHFETDPESGAKTFVIGDLRFEDAVAAQWGGFANRQDAFVEFRMSLIPSKTVGVSSSLGGLLAEKSEPTA